MYSYIYHMCQSCPGCALTNPTQSKLQSWFCMFDSYQAGAASGFKGSSYYLIACCGMCTFAAMEPVANANATTYATAIMKIILYFGFCHTCILDKDSKLFGVYREALDLLQINCHILSSGNHNSILP